MEFSVKIQKSFLTSTSVFCFRFRLEVFLLVVVVLFVAQVCEQHVQVMRNSDRRVRIFIDHTFNSNFHLVFFLVNNLLPLQMRIQCWSSLESIFSGQMIFHLLAKCFYDKTLTLFL